MKRTAFLIGAALLLAALGANPALARNGKGKGNHESMHWVMGEASGPLGLQVTSMTEELRGYFGAPKDAGILVSRVEADRPAERAGVQVGDVLVDIDGDQLAEPWDVWKDLAGKNKGDQVKLTVIRRGQRKTLDVELDRAVVQPGARFGLGDDFDFGDIDSFPRAMMRGDHSSRMKKLEDDIARLENKIDALERKLNK